MYYECVICYVDDVICISNDTRCTMEVIKAKLKLKGNKIEEPDIYLGAELLDMTRVDGQKCWDMSSEKYCTAATKNVEYAWKSLV